MELPVAFSESVRHFIQITLFIQTQKKPRTLRGRRGVQLRIGPMRNQTHQFTTQKPVAVNGGRSIPMARVVGTSMLIMEDINVETLELRHQAKLAVMPRASMVNTTGGYRFLEAGIDALSGDVPQRKLISIQSIPGASYLPAPGESAADLFSVTM